MSTTWTNEAKLASAPSISYDEAGTIYDGNYNYNGQVLGTWTNEQKS